MRTVELDIENVGLGTEIITTKGPIPMGVSRQLLQTAITRAKLVRCAQRGLTARVAAKIAGCHSATAQSHYRDPSFRAQVIGKVENSFVDVDLRFEESTKTWAEKLEEQATRSFEALIELVDDPKVKADTKVKIHQDFLDRFEESAPVSRTSHKLDPEQLKRASQVAQEMDNVIVIAKAS